MKARPPFIPHVPFDIILAEPAFPPVKPPNEDNDQAFQDVRDFSIKCLSSLTSLLL